MNKSKAVLTSDVHFNLNTLSVARQAMEYIISYAENNKLPLVIAGDLHDTKAQLRAEVVNSMLEVFSGRKVNIFILVGNHDKINEKSDDNALEFLNTQCLMVKHPIYSREVGAWLIPYQHDLDRLRNILKGIKPGSTIIMHQGLSGANMGHYIQDKTALTLEDVKPFRVISGHYHRRQTIGNFDYIGNPYTLTFGEANDGPKGFQVLHDDGSLEFHPLPLRKHVVMEYSCSDYNSPGSKFLHEERDNIFWIKIHGTQSELAKIKKQDVASALDITDFKFDKIPTDSEKIVEYKADRLSNDVLLDALIDNINETPEQKQYLKNLWRKFI